MPDGLNDVDCKWEDVLGETPRNTSLAVRTRRLPHGCMYKQWQTYNPMRSARSCDDEWRQRRFRTDVPKDPTVFVLFQAMVLKQLSICRVLHPWSTVHATTGLEIWEQEARRVDQKYRKEDRAFGSTSQICHGCSVESRLSEKHQRDNRASHTHPY